MEDRRRNTMTIRIRIKNDDVVINEGRIAIISEVDFDGNKINGTVLSPQDEVTVYIHGSNSISIEEGV
jgi:hypothetical protein